MVLLVRVGVVAVAFSFGFIFILVLLCSFIFFFKQKTAYEMRISDWSSDVCSSDLCQRSARGAVADRHPRRWLRPGCRRGCRHRQPIPHRTRRTIPTRRRDADRHRGRDRLSRRRPRQEPLQMNYNNHRPGLKARAAHLALALSSAAAVLTLGVSAVTAMPASAAGMASEVAQALKLRLPKTPIDAISCEIGRAHV